MLKTERKRDQLIKSLMVIYWIGGGGVVVMVGRKGLKMYCLLINEITLTRFIIRVRSLWTSSSSGVGGNGLFGGPPDPCCVVGAADVEVLSSDKTLKPGLYENSGLDKSKTIFFSTIQMLSQNKRRDVMWVYVICYGFWWIIFFFKNNNYKWRKKKIKNKFGWLVKQYSFFASVLGEQWIVIIKCN